MCFRWRPVKGKPFECSCDLCAENFGTIEGLTKHMKCHDIQEINRRIMDGYETVRCNICFKAFVSITALREHRCSSAIAGLTPVPSYESLDSPILLSH